ncbi:MAG: heme-binding domain-containing protein [Anaerolineaceae bacterium]|nr:heme-binding domain-containing protein [Anaerolineaceae bacterium]
MKKILIFTLVGLVAFFLLIQLIPLGRQHANPPVVQEPQWDSAQTRELAQRACFDCHSNETVWLWYSNVAPVSWLVQRDVNEGREKLNFSDWGSVREKDAIIEVIQEGEMPMPIYLIMHPEARLTSAEKEALIRGLQATINNQ